MTTTVPVPRLIPDVSAVTPERFLQEIVPAGQPVVLRGAVRHWPVVQAALQGQAALFDYLRQFDRGYDLDTFTGPPSTGGRIFYNEDMSGLNARMGTAKLSTALDFLAAHALDDPAPLFAIQSATLSRYLPGFELENPLALLPSGVAPRIWIGGRATVAAHFDSSENLACCVAGRRRFTLFPPAEIGNLYVGPFELTPAGAVISLVDFDQPDFVRFPRFRQALAAACTAELEPGDAIYVPYLWWHHVRSLDPVNILVNYWWEQVEGSQGEVRAALMHAIMVLRGLPQNYREAWQAHYRHYIFEPTETAAAHIPEARRGILGKPAREMLAKLRANLARALSRS